MLSAVRYMQFWAESLICNPLGTEGHCLHIRFLGGLSATSFLKAQSILHHVGDNSPKGHPLVSNVFLLKNSDAWLSLSSATWHQPCLRSNLLLVLYMYVIFGPSEWCAHSPSHAGIPTAMCFPRLFFQLQNLFPIYTTHRFRMALLQWKPFHWLPIRLVIFWLLYNFVL